MLYHSLLSMPNTMSEKPMNKVYLSIIAILVLIIAAGAYKFMIQGSVKESQDGRLALQLDEGERDLVLAEMRAFLESVQQITQGITEKDMQRVAEYARKVGRAAQGEVPGSLMGKLPVAFKKLGFDTHSRFDQLALDAEQLGDEQHSLNQLSQLMQNCVGCHAVYRIEVTDRH
jgi:hypothetical protein